MSVQLLRLSHFRNYEVLELSLGKGLNVLYGQNAQGKTNALESLYFLATTRLLRGSRDAEAIRRGASLARVSATLAPFETEISLAIEPGRRKIAQLNGIGLPRASDLIGRLPCICVSAFDMQIIRGEPAERRLFLDLELSQLSPSYLNHLAHYKRALEQRNALLRRAQEESVSPLSFEPWEAVLAEHGAALRTARRDLVDKIRPLARALHGKISKSEHLEIAYVGKDEGETIEALADALVTNRSREIARGSTLIGPHRDDLALLLAEVEARSFGSQGQQRTAVLALKLATYLHQAEVQGDPPLLLLDDMLSDLDEGRRQHLVEWVLEHAKQAVMTCTEPEAAGPRLLERAELFRVVDGMVEAQ